MRQTLFYISNEPLGPLPLFGVIGWVSLAWIAFSALLLAWLVRRQGWTPETRSYLPVIGIVWLVIAFVIPLLVHFSSGVPIRGYGVMLLLGVVAGVLTAAWRAQRMGVDPEIIFSLAVVLFITAILGARTFYVIQYWEQFSKVDGREADLGELLFGIVNVTQGGLVVYGALIGGLAGAIWFLRRHRLPMLAIADLIAPSMLIGLCLGRLGCLLNGCCFGGLCEYPWAVTFPYQSPPYQSQMHERQVPHLGIRLRELELDADEDGPQMVVIISSIDQEGIAHEKGLAMGERITHIDGREVTSLAQAKALLLEPREQISIRQESTGTIEFALPRSQPAHPTQIYSAINAIILAALLWLAYPFRPRDGFIMALMLTLYPITRFVLEIIRSDEPGRWGTGLTISQLVSLGLLVIACGLWFYIFRRTSTLALPPKQPLTFASG